MEKKPPEPREMIKAKIIDYLSDPENEWPNKVDLAVTVLGYAHVQALYNHFSVQEMHEMYREGLEARKKNAAYGLGIAYNALLKASKDGNVQAIKEYIERLEGKVPDQVNSNVNQVQTVQIELVRPKDTDTR